MPIFWRPIQFFLLQPVEIHMESKISKIGLLAGFFVAKTLNKDICLVKKTSRFRLHMNTARTSVTIISFMNSFSQQIQFFSDEMGVLITRYICTHYPKFDNFSVASFLECIFVCCFSSIPKERLSLILGPPNAYFEPHKVNFLLSHQVNVFTRFLVLFFVFAWVFNFS